MKMNVVMHARDVDFRKWKGPPGLECYRHLGLLPSDKKQILDVDLKWVKGLRLPANQCSLSPDLEYEFGWIRTNEKRTIRDEERVHAATMQVPDLEQKLEDSYYLPRAASEGDIIVMAKGGGLPLVLRPRHHESHAHDETYTYVGAGLLAASLHDIGNDPDTMYGHDDSFQQTSRHRYQGLMAACNAPSAFATRRRFVIV